MYKLHFDVVNLLDWCLLGPGFFGISKSLLGSLKPEFAMKIKTGGPK